MGYSAHNAHFKSLYNIVTLKVRSSHKTLNTSLPCPYNGLVLVWSYSSHLFKIESAHKHFFLSKFGFQRASMALEIRSRSPKSNHFFPLIPIMYLC